MARWLKVLLILLLLSVLGLIALVYAATQTEWLVRRFRPTQMAAAYRSAELDSLDRLGQSPPESTRLPPVLRVMSWNIKFGGARYDFFWDCYGDKVNMSRQEVLHNLEQLADFLNQVQPHILFLQEVDVGSDRVAGLDQVQWLLNHTHFHYGYYASQWDAHVPSQGIGRVNSGNAILSLWPLQQPTRHALPLIASQDSLTRLFYLRRNMLSARLPYPTDTAPGQAVYLINTHLSAYAQDSTRWRQLQQLKQLADSLGREHDLILGGDLNTLPPGTQKAHDFDDSVCEEDFVMDDYRRELTWLTPFYQDYLAAVPLQAYLEDESRYYSHTVNGRGWWNRKLDYLFVRTGWAPQAGRVLQDSTGLRHEPMRLSDHAPLEVTVCLWNDSLAQPWPTDSAARQQRRTDSLLNALPRQAVVEVGE